MIFSRAIFWKGGKPMEPHHFQLTERLARSERQGSMEGLFHWPWGFASLEVSEEALGRGFFTIDRMDLVLPGGLRLTAPGNCEIEPAEIPWEELRESDELTAYIAAPHFSHVGPNAEEPPWEVSGARSAELRAAEGFLGGEPVRFPRYRDLSLAAAGAPWTAGTYADGPGGARADGGPGVPAGGLPGPSPAAPAPFPPSPFSSSAPAGGPSRPAPPYPPASGDGRPDGPPEFSGEQGRHPENRLLSVAPAPRAAFAEGGPCPPGGSGGERGSVTAGRASPGAPKLMTSYLEPCPVPDMHAGGGRAWLDTLAFTPRLAFGPREADARGLFLVPVARIARAGEGARLAPFAPPAVRLYKDGLLRSAALEVLELLRAKGRELEEYKLSAQRSRERGGGREPSERALAVALGVALRHIARLHHLLNAPSAHPHQVYSAMSELASELGIFAQRGTGFSFRGWDQWDPGPAFLEMREAVARLLEEVSPGPNLSLVLRREGAKFECALPPLPEGELGFWIAARTQMHADEAKLAVPAGARLASPGRMAELVATGLPGVGLTPVRDAPAGLPRRADTVYFAVRDKDPMWEEAVREGRLELRWPDAPAKAQLTLVAVRF